MNPILEEKRRSSLKFTNLNWITVQSSSYKYKGRTVSRPSTAGTARTTRSEPEYFDKPFANSKLTFTKEEMECINQSSHIDPNKKLTKTPSQLQNILNRQSVRASIKTAKAAKKSGEESKENLLLTEQDSFISINLDEEDDYIQNQSPDQNPQDKTENSQKFEKTPDVSKDDLKGSIWSYTHETRRHGPSKRVREIRGSFKKSSDGIVASILPSSGQRKIMRTIQRVTPTGGVGSIFEIEQVNTGYATQRAKLSKEMESSFCAYKFCKFFEAQNRYPPEVLDNLNFKPVAKTAKIKSNSQSIQDIRK
ncbi:hypothetical protein TVAG_397120 [Trichomonas vaginalis G3]|uniref:Uncharacterized protein n=1 Tax=Trichomonas vaginalis (strain ATCC PRA-98 / G3) TaxID=412133 RepID=A2DX99_TRIV3|nr:hypothetical protein TVAGG3_0673070 [Trichomonas vaginalis G3]EAY14981.1 hypothetical protein TVAG_397120 [Trichomonas vaginalis G3]KAI5507342.1 hypothetical protein TVAGG3_0673070 [Trichomonas vaginalis G3]|eukprot:XP_001327204.1 hypothetical protein [Trichomonas vaginalis G3]